MHYSASLRSLLITFVCFHYSRSCAPVRPSPGPVTTTTVSPVTTTTTGVTTTTTGTTTTAAPATGCNACADLPLTGGNLGGGVMAGGGWTYGTDAGCKTASLVCATPMSSVTMDVFYMGEYLNLDQECNTVTLAYPVTCNADGVWETTIQGITIMNPMFGCAATSGTGC